MARFFCPIADYNSDFCCEVAQEGRECFSECHECVLTAISNLSEFLSSLIDSCVFLNEKK